MAETPLHRHPAPHRELARRYRHYAAQQEFRISVALSIAMFLASLIAVFYAIGYATERASNAVTDIVLSNMPAFDVGGLFINSTFVFIGFITLLLAAHPKRIPFALHSLALFYFLRAGFISLTHIGPFPIVADPSSTGAIANVLINGADLFFSGHVGASFLMALIFWKDFSIRIAFFLWSIFFAVVVLLGHYHYSIDVAAAYFITYTIYHLALYFFPKDRALFVSDMPERV